MNSCVQLDGGFEGGYGDCTTYAPDEQNYHYCDDDHMVYYPCSDCTGEMIYAYETCTECGKCFGNKYYRIWARANTEYILCWIVGIKQLYILSFYIRASQHEPN